MTTLTALVASLLLLSVMPASAQDYPTKVITLIVPFTAGGPTDTVARLIAVPMTKTLNAASHCRKRGRCWRDDRRESGSQGGTRRLHDSYTPYRYVDRAGSVSQVAL